MKLTRETLTKIIEGEIQNERTRPPKWVLGDKIEQLVRVYLGQEFDLESEEQRLINKFITDISKMKK
jgi:hypothetical protein